MKRKKEGKPFDIVKEKRIKFAGMLQLIEYQKEYFTTYPYGYWLHKGLAIMHFIEDKSRLPTLRFPLDIDTDDYILDNLKMEIHMMVFHSAESLFLNILGHYFYPALPWFWMSTCDQRKFNSIMKLWNERGIASIINDPETWLRNILYPTITESRAEYQKTKDSAAFVREYIDRLVHEYTRHNEYNAYKHGLRLFPAPGRFRAVDDATGDVFTDIQGDFLEFVEYEPPTDHDYEYRVKRTSKKYDVSADMEIIRTTTGILMLLLERQRINIKTPRGQKFTFNVIYFDDQKVEDIFNAGYFEMSL